MTPPNPRGLSDSEGEQEGPHSQVTVSQNIKDRGVARNATNAIRFVVLCHQLWKK